MVHGARVGARAMLLWQTDLVAVGLRVSVEMGRAFPFMEAGGWQTGRCVAWRRFKPEDRGR